MFYTIDQSGNRHTIEEVFTDCTTCGKQLEIDPQLLHDILEDGDLLSTTVSCCAKPSITRIK